MGKKADELSIEEILEVLHDPEDGWVKIEEAAKVLGIIPQEVDWDVIEELQNSRSATWVKLQPQVLARLSPSPPLGGRGEETPPELGAAGSNPKSKIKNPKSKIPMNHP